MATVLVCRNGSKWVVLKKGAKRASHQTVLRRDAISEAKRLAGPKGVVTVHNSAGVVVIRIPELPTAERVAAAVYIKRAGDMTPAGRARIATWLRQHAADLLKLGKQYAGNFRGRYYISA